MLFPLIDTFSLIFIFYFWISFEHFFLWFSFSFLPFNAFSLFSCWWYLLFFLFAFGNFRLYICFVIVIFLLKCNLISNYFWLTSSGGCPNHTFRCPIPQGTQTQGGQAHLAKNAPANQKLNLILQFPEIFTFVCKKAYKQLPTIPFLPP